MKKLSMTDAEENVSAPRQAPKQVTVKGPAEQGLPPKEKKYITGFKNLVQGAAKIEAVRRLRQK